MLVTYHSHQLSLAILMWVSTLSVSEGWVYTGTLHMYKSYICGLVV